MNKGFVCVSCIDTADGRFVRPVIRYPERPGIKKDFLFNGRRLVIRPLVYVELDFVRPCPCSSWHTEDWEINPAVPPRLAGVPDPESQRLLLEKHLDHSLEQALYDQSRSLVVIRPQQVPRVSMSLFEDRLRTHLTFRDQAGDLQRRLPVTDANWLAVSRWLYQLHGGDLKRTADNLRFYLKNTGIYLRVGITRKFHGQRWRQVSGVFSFPDWIQGRSFADYDYDFDDHV
jgi:hypothetical protein